MQTPFDIAASKSDPSNAKPRSVFKNFKTENEADAEVSTTAALATENGRAGPDGSGPAGGAWADDGAHGVTRPTRAFEPAAVKRLHRSQREAGPLQAAIDSALARSFIYRFLAHAFDDPSPERWASFTNADLHAALLHSVQALLVPSEPAASPLWALVGTLADRLRSGTLSAFTDEYFAAFGHAARGLCPLNEIEYGDLKADALFQPHRLADLAAFYRAFGLEVSEDAAERHDHLCIELEFMSVLAAKEAYALKHQLEAEHLALGRDAEKKFLREHLGRWTPAFTRRLARMVAEHSLRHALANFTRAFIASDCARFGVMPGSDDLLLRPVDAAADSLCAACGITNLPPGALHATIQP